LPQGWRARKREAGLPQPARSAAPVAARPPAYMLRSSSIPADRTGCVRTLR
jgi:hypothetical protein